MGTIWIVIMLVLSLLCTVYGIIVGSSGAGTGFYLIWFAIAALLVGIVLVAHFHLWEKMPGILKKLLAIVTAVGVVSFVIIEGCVISGFHSQEATQVDYLIVLGAQVRESGPSPVLVYRLDKAVEYLNENPETICIVSGGQGGNEPFPEAEGMADYLMDKGIAQDRLILEDRSKTTEENFANSIPYIEEDASVGVITNDFHMFRALQIARSQGLENAQGITASSTKLFLPNNMLREYFAEVVYWVRKMG